MSPEIRRLPPEVCNQIAAGEVVERPASVVKELVENALDAGADEIRVGLEEGGKRLIEVVDNGCGMSPAQARLALERHATSKLTSAADLFGIASYGFRGEALPSIAAVSRFVLVSRLAGAESAVRLELVGEELHESRVGAPVGTRVTVADLFCSVPARKKFLKTVNTERAAVLERLQRFAIAHPEVAFTLEHNGRRLFKVTAGDREPERVAAVLGIEEPGRLLRVVVGGGDDYRLTAWLAPPDLQRSSSRQLCFFVNRRPVRDKLLLQALLKAYEGTLPRGRYPLAALFLEAAPGMVDVNVHPAKEEVRFAEPGRIFALVRQAVAELLSGYPGAGGVVWAPPAAKTPAGEEDRFGAERGASGQGGGPLAPASFPGAAADETRRAALPPDFFVSAPGETLPVAARPPQVREDAFVPISASAGKRPPSRFPEIGAGEGGAAAGLPANGARLPGELADPEVGFFSSMRYLGTLWRSYLVLEKGEQCYLLDQHAAHERVLFEELKRMPPGASQPLLLPLTIECSATLVALAEEQHQRLAELGFTLEILGPRTLLLRSRPQLAEELAPGELLLETLEDLAAGGGGEGAVGLDELKARLACRMAVKAGNELDRAAVGRLLEKLDHCPRAHTCPHGRPFYFALERAEIERRFKR